MEITPEFAYWLGVVQTDGSYFTGYINKKKKNPTIGHIINLEVSGKSRDMIEKFVKVSTEVFDSKAKIGNRIKRVNGKEFPALNTTLGIGRYINEIKSFGINLKLIEPPKIFTTPEQVGAYIAGLIDGDGSIRIKLNKHVKRRECYIRIASGNEPKELKDFIATTLISNVHYRKQRNVEAFDLEFLINHKNRDFFRKFILPQMAIVRKKDKLIMYIDDLEKGKVMISDSKTLTLPS